MTKNNTFFNKKINKNLFNRANVEIFLICLVLFVSIGLVVYFVMTDKTTNVNQNIEIRYKPDPEPESQQNNQKTGKEIILFYAKWCGPSQKFLPVWEKLQENFSNSCNFVTIDVDNDPEGMANEFKVKGMPTIFVGCNNTYTEYGGPRTYEALVSFIDNYPCN